MAVLRVENLTLEIPGRRLLDNISFDLERGESIAIMGPSGAGKTSLINCVCGIVKPTSGRIWLVDSEVTLQTASKRAASRLANVGYVFQFGELLPEISVLENVALPLKLRGVPWDDAERRAAHQLETVGLAHRFSHLEESPTGELGSQPRDCGFPPRRLPRRSSLARR